MRSWEEELEVPEVFYQQWPVDDRCYEWDEAKSSLNAKKHRVRFADAVGVFARYVATGMDFLGRFLTVVYTYRPDTIRLISARRATKRERETYEEGRY